MGEGERKRAGAIEYKPPLSCGVVRSFLAVTAEVQPNATGPGYEGGPLVLLLMRPAPWPLKLHAASGLSAILNFSQEDRYCAPCAMGCSLAIKHDVKQKIC